MIAAWIHDGGLDEDLSPDWLYNYVFSLPPEERDAVGKIRDAQIAAFEQRLGPEYQRLVNQGNRELRSLVPGVGAPDSIGLGADAWKEGNEIAALLEWLGVIPPLKVFKFADEGADVVGGVRQVSRAADEGVGVVKEFVDLTSRSRRTHILHGDASGGGHLWPGLPGKTPFPQNWSGDRIIHEISDIATDPSAVRRSVGSRTVVEGTHDGVDIRVILDKNAEIVTGYPTNLPRNQ